VWIPVLGRVAAGLPIEAVEYIEDYEEITLDMATGGEHFALRITGDSMEPRMKENDVVIVRKQSDCNDGDVAVVIVNGEDATIKRIKKRPEGIMLIPSNPRYEPMFFSNEDVQKLPIAVIGKVVELRAKF
jgi:repressor LexA